MSGSMPDIVLTSIDLPDLRQRQFNLIPVERPLPRLQRITLEVYRVQLFLVTQDPPNLFEALQLAITGPKLFKMCQRLKP